MKRYSYFLFLFLAVQVVPGFAQGHFVVAFNGNGQDHMIIHVLTATLGGENLKAGDEVAVFDGAICCGAKILTQPINYSNPATYIDIAVSKADAGLPNGYTTGNTISYKFWDSIRQKEISGIASAYFDPITTQPTTTPTFRADESVFVKLSGTLAVNQPPVSNAGANQTVNEGSLVTLNGSASSDPNQDPLTFSWTAPSGITLSSATVAQPVFWAPEVHADTPYSFSLVVNDGTVNSAASQVIVTVKHVDKAPYVTTPITDISVDLKSPDRIIDLKSVFADDDPGDALTYSITSNTNPRIVTPEISGASLTLRFSEINSGISEMEISASSQGVKTQSKFKVEVNIPTGIDPEGSGIQLFPNPAKDRVFLKFNQTPRAGTRVTIYSISGKVVYQSTTGAIENQLNLQGIPSGLYFLKIEQDNPKTYKIILK